MHYLAVAGKQHGLARVSAASRKVVHFNHLGILTFNNLLKNNNNSTGNKFRTVLTVVV
jgi:hypothetical protein